MRERSLFLERLVGVPKTTNSLYSLPVFRNLVKEMEVVSPNQVWVSDITYIRTDQNDWGYGTHNLFDL